MALLGNLRATFTADFDGFIDSIASIGDALLAAHGVRERFADDIARLSDDSISDRSIPLRFNGFDLLRFEVVNRSAGRADEISIRCEPDRGYWELVSAISRDLHGDFSFELHNGWPILSRVVPRSDTSTDAGGASSSAGGGSEA